MVKISSFIVGMVIVSLFMACMALFYAQTSTQYSVTYDNETMDSFNKLNELSSTSRNIKNETSGVEGQTDDNDILGRFFSGGYNALKVATGSIDTFDKITNNAIGSVSGLGPTGNLLKTALITIVIILIFIGVVMAALLKWYT